MPPRHFHPSQSLAGAVREHLADIELQIFHGVRLAAVHAKFVEQGHSPSFKNFQSALYRARKQLKERPAGAANRPLEPHSRLTRAVVAPVVEQAVSAGGDRSAPPGEAVSQEAPTQERNYFSRKPMFGKT